MRLRRGWQAVWLIAFVLLVAVAGCSSPSELAGGGTSAAPVQTETPEASATEEPTAEPTAEPTPEPTQRPTATPVATLTRVHQLVYAWGQEFGDYTNYQVIVSLENSGGGWAEVSGFDSDFQVLDADGGLTATGSFIYAFPEFIGPGETGYLIADGIEEAADPATFASVEADGRFDVADEPDVSFTFDEINLVKHSYDAGYTATGFVTATGDVTDAGIAVVCVDAEGKPLGATWTNLVQNLTSGERKGFETVTSTPALDPAQCAELRAFGLDQGF